MQLHLIIFNCLMHKIFTCMSKYLLHYLKHDNSKNLYICLMHKIITCMSKYLLHYLTHDNSKNLMLLNCCKFYCPFGFVTNITKDSCRTIPIPIIGTLYLDLFRKLETDLPAYKTRYGEVILFYVDSLGPCRVVFLNPSYRSCKRGVYHQRKNDVASRLSPWVSFGCRAINNGSENL